VLYAASRQTDIGGISVTQVDAQAATSAETGATGATKSPAPRKPTRSLPTNRVAFAKQLDVLRAFAIASGPTEKVVKTTDVAGIVGIHFATVQLVNPFFTDNGLVLKVEGGYMPSPEVVAFNQASAWNKETAPGKLAPLLGRAWFGEALLPKLALRPLDEPAAVALLAEACSAGPQYRSQLAMLLDYLDASGLIAVEGGMVHLGRATDGAVAPTAPASVPADGPAAPAPERRDATVRPTVATSFTKDLAEGLVQFNVSVRVNMSEFGSWEADRITAFFSGIAKVLAAKSGIEEEGAGGT
jgi:hypothetical protein